MIQRICGICAALGILACSNVAWAEASLIKIGGGLRVHSSSTTAETESTTAGGVELTSEVDYDQKIYGSGYVQFQHGVPFVPNVRISTYSYEPKVKSSSSILSIRHTSAELFYTFGFAVVEAQVGAAYQSFTIGEGAYQSFTIGEGNDADKSGFGLTGNVIIDIPVVPLTPSVNFDIGLGVDKVNSFGVNLAYTLLPGFNIDLGIKNYTYSFNNDANENINDDGIDHTVTNKSVYLGASFNIGL